MDNIRENIVLHARKYINTPFHDQGRLKNVGIDCVGVPLCIAEEVNINVYDIKGYANVPSKGLFEKHVISQLDRVNYEDIQIGDLIVFKFTREPQHIAIITEITPVIKILHAYSIAGKVVEHDFDEYWKRRVVGYFKFKGI